MTKISIEIITQKISNSNRDIVMNEDQSNFIQSINGYQPHGIDWILSERDEEVKAINYSINGIFLYF